MPDASETSPVPAGLPPLTRRHRLLLASLLVAVFACYALTLRYGFVYDDIPQVVENTHLQWHNVASFFTHPLWQDTPDAPRFYRPLLLLWFLLNKSLFGLHAPGFHVTSVLLHVLTTCMVFQLVRRCVNDNAAALVGASLFGLHPLRVETVAWISDANDSLAAIACIAMILCFMRYQASRRPVFLLGSWSAYAVALLTKESVILMPLVLLAVPGRASAKAEQAWRRRAFPFIGYPMICGLYLLARFHALGVSLAVPSNVRWSTAILSAPKALFFYLQKIVWPDGLSPHYAFHYIDSPWEHGAWLWWGGFLLLATGVAYGLRVWGAQGWLAGLWSMAALLPALNLRLVNVGDPVHDRYLYISSIGLSILIGWGWIGLAASPLRRIAKLSLPVLLVLFWAMSFTQTVYWSSDGALFGRAVCVQPDSFWAHMNYGATLSHNHRHQEAYDEFVTGYRLEPSWRLALFAGLEAKELGSNALALAWFRKAVALDPYQADGWFQLGEVYRNMNDPATAANALQQALLLAPDRIGWHTQLGQALEEQGKNAEAVSAYRKELQLHPDQVNVRQALERLELSTPTTKKTD